MQKTNTVIRPIIGGPGRLERECNLVQYQLQITGRCFFHLVGNSHNWPNRETGLCLASTACSIYKTERMEGFAGLNTASCSPLFEPSVDLHFIFS